MVGDFGHGRGIGKIRKNISWKPNKNINCACLAKKTKISLIMWLTEKKCFKRH